MIKFSFIVSLMLFTIDIMWINMVYNKNGHCSLKNQTTSRAIS